MSTHSRTLCISPVHANALCLFPFPANALSFGLALPTIPHDGPQPIPCITTTAAAKYVVFTDALPDVLLLWLLLLLFLLPVLVQVAFTVPKVEVVHGGGASHALMIHHPKSAEKLVGAVLPTCPLVSLLSLAPQPMFPIPRSS